jgi:thioredoxin-related protein
MIAVTIVLLALLPDCGQLFGQNPNISGTWVLKERKVISGSDFANGIPKQMMITVSGDSLYLIRIYDGGSEKDNVVNESLPLNGFPVEELREVSKRKSFVKKGLDDKTFSIETTFRDKKTGERTNADYVEKWNIAESGKELTIEKYASRADGTSWSMKGIYELKTKEQAEQELATGKGIQFVENKSWEEIKALAKKENKFIFVDCFATWCVPCKQMEKDIFPLNRVGAEMNDKFISVHLQMDTSKKDNNEVKKWYATAHQFLSQYNLIGYPTFLFFGPNGNIVHKGLGKYEADEFLTLLKAAKDPGQQYYTLLDGYKKGQGDYQNIPLLAITAQQLGDKKLANYIINDYKKNFLTKLPQDSLLSRKYLLIALKFQNAIFFGDGSHGVFFKLFCKRGNEVDQALGQPGYSDYAVNAIVTKEEIQDRIYVNKKLVYNPQWEKYRSSIQKKYNKLNADSLVLNAKIEYYGAKKDWNNQVNCFVKKIEQYGPLSVGFNADGMGSDNVIAGILLPHCEDKKILIKATGWMEQIIHSKAYSYPIPMVYGNYGALLYKAGKTKEGIEAFERQIHAIGYNGPEDLAKDPRFKPKVDYVERMKRGEKIDSTWNPAVFN